MISKSSVHAILAVTFLARLKSNEFSGASHIAENIKAPKNYLGKILNRLAAEGLLESTKGYNGGFKLSLPASKITIYDIVNPIENLSKWENCFLGDKTCSCTSPCEVHDSWHKIRSDYINFLEKTTIEMIVNNDLKI